MAELNNINAIIGYPMSSICCRAQTHIGYYNPDQRPDIHGIITKSDIAIGLVGTYCSNCGKLCDYTDDKGNEYYTNGIKKENYEKIH